MPTEGRRGRRERTNNALLRNSYRGRACFKERVEKSQAITRGATGQPRTPTWEVSGEESGRAGERDVRGARAKKGEGNEGVSYLMATWYMYGRRPVSSGRLIVGLHSAIRHTDRL